MAIRKPKPTSPGRRFATYSDYRELTRDEPEKTLTEGLKKSGGRNVHGRKTSRHRGGGAKRLYRKIDFRRRKDGVPARVASIEYDPNRSAHIALLHYADGEKRYILAPQTVKIGRAGRRRHLGARPQTRGTAMNPVDHPHGGGEGSTTPGRHPVTPWGVPTLGYPTRKKNKPSDRMIVRRRRRGKGKR